MAPNISFTPYSRVAPNWLGSRITDPKVVIPGGILLEAADFPLVAAKKNKRFIEGGTLVGRTLAERDTGKGYGPADPALDEQFALLLHDVADADEDNVCPGIQPKAGNVIYENLLPSWAGLTVAAKAKVRELYHCLSAIA